MPTPEKPDQRPGPNMDIDTQVTDIFGPFIPVTPRFSLAQGNSRDVMPIAEQRTNDSYRFRRFLVVPEDMIDEVQWQQLSEGNVSTIPLIDRGKHSYIFGVMDGLKPLSHEALFTGESTQTYVSDAEIFTTVGQAFRSYFEATNSLPLSSLTDNPLGRLAIKNFIDDRQPILYFFPPFNPPATLRGIELAEAANIFDAALGAHLLVQGPSEGPSEHIAELLAAAHSGFLKAED